MDSNFCRSMIRIYRKRKDGSRWHFHAQCPNWPEVNYVQLQFLQLVTRSCFIRTVDIWACATLQRLHSAQRLVSTLVIRLMTIDALFRKEINR